MKKLVALMLLFFTFNIYSQKEANFWYFGEESGLDFSTNPPNAIKGSLSTDEGSASISDSNGVLQFYTDGSTVYDRTGAIMNNGVGLLGDSSSAQSAIIVPKPKDPNIYYVFTVGNQTGSGTSGNGVMYSIVDMSLNVGFGAVTSKNINLNSSENAREKITSVRGDACNTFWVITSDRNNFYAYLIDENGVQNSAITSIHNNNLDNLRGYLKISPDGTTLVNASASSGTYIFDFNAATGQIANGGRINGITNGGYGVEFSRNGKKLYISTGTYSQINNNGVRNQPQFASVTQFSLESKNITDINNSANLIYSTNEGYRGALQLASNGKIYYARSRTNFLGLINAPEKEAANINFVLDGLSLNQLSTEGLPPFIQSFFLEIDIKDNETGNIVNNQNLQFCIGQDKIIKPAVVPGTGINYEWTFDDGTTISEISSSSTITDLTLNDIQTTNSGNYQLKITLKDICDNDIEYNATFNIAVFEAATATKPDNINSCDEDLNGSNTFDLQNDTDLKDKILTGLDISNFDILYFDDLDKANDNVAGTDVPNPFTLNTGSTQIIYARVQNINAPEACFALTTFTISVTGFPVPQMPSEYPFCDNTSVGSDTDGFVDDFILENKDAQILGSLDPNQYTVSYHTTQNGAQTNTTLDAIPKTTNYANTTANIQPVYVRVENVDNAACFDASKSFNLIVNPLPILKTNPELEQCISAVDNSPTVNLTTAQVSISETANVTFDYFEDITATNQITDPTSYPVIVNTRQAVFVRVTSEFGCPRDLIELTINIGQTPDNPYNDIQTPACDDFLDADGNDSAANSDTDFITNFSLDKNAITTSINPPVNTIVYFYENADDRNNTVNEIDITNYRNDINRIDITTIDSGIQFPIYYKILSTVNNNCQGLGEFYLQINATPAASSITLSPILECDTGAIDGNYTNGSNRNIDLTQRIDELFIGTNQDQNDYVVTFYKSVTAAFSGDISSSDYIDTPTQFTNDVPSGFSVGDIVTQSIFVRVQNKTTGCVNPHARFEVIINPIPIITNPIPVLEVCDIGTNDGDVRNGLAQNIAISSRDIDIIGTRIAANFTITYHKTRADAEDLSSTGIDKNSYDSDPTRVTINPITNISEESLFIRIVDNNSGCAFDQSTLTIVVNPEPTFEAISNLSECDNNDDGDAANQIIQTIDLDGKITEILGASQDPDDYNVSFHNSKAAASSGNAPIASPYTNTSSIETIYVRIQSKATSCVNDDATFDILVNSLPDFTVTSPQIVCLNDTPKNISIENPLEIYSYVWRDDDGNTIGIDDNLDVTSGGNYTVTGTTTNGTNCSRTETIIVSESNPAILLNSFVTIVDEGNNIGNENNLSIVIDVITNDLGPGDYQFALKNDDQNTTTFYQEEPVFENLEGGIYTIIVNDKNGCVPNATLQVSVLQFPKFFTPNGDNKNDTWIIKGVNKTFYPNSSINIFNRYGKLVAQIPIDTQGWNGTYNGKKLTPNDYWYNITLIPADATKQTINKTGNFSLLRK